MGCAQAKLAIEDGSAADSETPTRQGTVDLEVRHVKIALLKMGISLIHLTPKKHGRHSRELKGHRGLAGRVLRRSNGASWNAAAFD